MPDISEKKLEQILAQKLAELMRKNLDRSTSPLTEPIKEPKTITVYVCPQIVEWKTITIGSQFSPIREPLKMPNQGQGYLAVFYSREEYDLVHPGFDPWVFKFTVIPNPYYKKTE